MTTPEQIQSAYSNTLQCLNRYPIEECLNNGHGEKARVIAGILHYLRLEKSPFGSSESFEHGLQKFFQVIYKMGEFEIILKDFWYDDEEFPFNTVESFAKWLNDCERRILESTQCLNT